MGVEEARVLGLQRYQLLLLAQLLTFDSTSLSSPWKSLITSAISNGK
jgi:hypothetical protein